MNTYDETSICILNHHQWQRVCRRLVCALYVLERALRGCNAEEWIVHWRKTMAGLSAGDKSEDIIQVQHHQSPVKAIDDE